MVPLVILPLVPLAANCCHCSGTLTFACYMGLGLFFGVQNFEFRYFGGFEVCQLFSKGMPI